jgi:hypothetical protein
MIGPKLKPTDFPGELTPVWSHLIANDITEVMKAFSHTGQPLWEIPCLCRGQGGEHDWHTNGSDTPPGLYKLGALYDDVKAHGEHPAYGDDQMLAYGWQTYDLISLDHEEERSGRAGICLHGGGSGNGWPGAWAPKQHLLPTRGCIRIHNIELVNRIHPLYLAGAVFVSVYQEG